jgi:hypothetical protein
MKMDDTFDDETGKRFYGLPLLYEMLRSFSALAKTLNLSEAVRQTGQTRQTLRRHIATLEEFRGEALFELDDRRYRLTDAGTRALGGAEDILARGDAWLKNQLNHVGGLIHVSNSSSLGVDYHLQQHPLGAAWRDGEPLIQQAFQTWAAAKGEIDAPEMSSLRPFGIVFRPSDQAYLCVEVGAESSYATWYGSNWARSTIGLSATDLPAGVGFGRLLSSPFEEVLISEGFRYDHIATKMIREKGGPLIPITYQRLLLAISFPNGSRGILSIVERTRNISIVGFEQSESDLLPLELVMNSTTLA